MIIKMKSEIYNGLRSCVAINDFRYYLKGIFIDMPNKCAVATDGHSLLRAPLDDCDPETNGELAFIMEVSTRQAPRGGEVWIDTMSRQISFFKKSGLRHRTEKYEEIDAKYVDYERVIPDLDDLQDSFKSVAFNPFLIARTFSAMGVMDTNKIPAAKLRAVDDSGTVPFVIPLPGYPDVTFVVMPCRINA